MSHFLNSLRGPGMHGRSGLYFKGIRRARLRRRVTQFVSSELHIHILQRNGWCDTNSSSSSKPFFESEPD